MLTSHHLIWLALTLSVTGYAAGLYGIIARKDSLVIYGLATTAWAFFLAVNS